MTQETPAAGTMLGSREITQIIPHRYPILLVDKAKIVEIDKKIVGYKSVSGNEPFFQGHFPGWPIMPGVLIVEAMAQTSCILLLLKPETRGKKLAFFMGIDGVKFRKPVLPGDQLEMHIEVLRSGRVGKARGESFVAGEKVTEAEFTFAVVDKEAKPSA